ncbi:MAG TPA: hypothetical protein VM733_14335 [Thermoanaerobaculia bacterium]|nr:hypothetical protein [Thermoanaerobaculia bacterium]
MRRFRHQPPANGVPVQVSRVDPADQTQQWKWSGDPNTPTFANVGAPGYVLDVDGNAQSVYLKAVWETIAAAHTLYDLNGNYLDTAANVPSCRDSLPNLTEAKIARRREVAAHENSNLAGPTGLEPATSGVTGRRSKCLSADCEGRRIAQALITRRLGAKGADLVRQLVRITSLTSSLVEPVERRVIGGYQYVATPRSFDRFDSFRSKVAIAS